MLRPIDLTNSPSHFPYSRLLLKVTKTKKKRHVEIKLNMAKVPNIRYLLRYNVYPGVEDSRAAVLSVSKIGRRITKLYSSSQVYKKPN